MATTVNTATKKDKIIYWVFTIIIMAFDAGGAIAFNSDLAKQGISHVGFPDFFRVELGIGKILGGIIILVPIIPLRLKEWAYVGFGISTLTAIIAHIVIDGPDAAAMPLVCFIILLVSYIYFNKIYKPYRDQ